MMTPIQLPALIEVDWWALGAVMALSVGAMVLLLMEFLPANRDSVGSPGTELEFAL